ncbi:sulfonate/nitrate/taurine transporter ATP-binding protein [Anaerocolumna sp. MB42-C2]|uniref:sulfonate/nitrate/taurine transporter ATP-binding protein n=1 Tax=Anaerocolumna sp. MB42-C2 TaxID=3070997 RepID=UPI0027E1E5D1|nr:sulfonate/nitrate/taurine transporter ATP-binding protein [Anaerocolumna sp. MB42-C2]WMJ87583.1 sulfonate/nitrate/taurine transporter ATP-binding protein [Anaerocolumna sp. MB42-C2]
MADRIIVLTSRPGTVKKVIEVHLTVDEKTPFHARSAPEFKDYFNLIWKELSQNEIK